MRRARHPKGPWFYCKLPRMKLFGCSCSNFRRCISRPKPNVSILTGMYSLAGTSEFVRRMRRSRVVADHETSFTAVNWTIAVNLTDENASHN